MSDHSSNFSITSHTNLAFIAVLYAIPQPRWITYGSFSVTISQAKQMANGLSFFKKLTTVYLRNQISVDLLVLARLEWLLTSYFPSCPRNKIRKQCIRCAIFIFLKMSILVFFKGKRFLSISRNWISNKKKSNWS